MSDGPTQGNLPSPHRGDGGLHRSRIVKALWPPALGWVPVGLILLMERRYEAFGQKAIMTMIMIAVPCAWLAAAACVVNFVRVAGWRDITPRLRYALVAANLSFPLAFGAFILLP